jgi:hypothetical protein
MSYRLLVPAAVFDLPEFAKSLGKTVKPREWETANLAAGHDGGFHAHVNWRPERKNPDNVQLQVEFHRWRMEPKTNIREGSPTADEVYQWAGKFLSIVESDIHVHAEFLLPVERWQVALLPLPWKIPYGKQRATIDGVSFELSSGPEDVVQGWVQTTKDDLTLQLFGTRHVVFDSFDIEKDVKAFGEIAGSLVVEKQT